MREANLTNAILTDVVADSTTKWPSGFPLAKQGVRIAPEFDGLAALQCQ
jgi:hypothetical protein